VACKELTKRQAGNKKKQYKIAGRNWKGKISFDMLTRTRQNDPTNAASPIDKKLQKTTRNMGKIRQQQLATWACCTSCHAPLYAPFFLLSIVSDVFSNLQCQQIGPNYKIQKLRTHSQIHWGKIKNVREYFGLKLKFTLKFFIKKRYNYKNNYFWT